MKNYKLAIIISMALLFSCNGAIVYEEIDLQAETEAWLTDDQIGDRFQMIDENGISSTWEVDDNYNYFNESGSAFLFIPTRKTMIEMHFQKFESSILGYFSINVDAGFSGENGSVSFSTGSLSSSFDASTHSPVSLHLSSSSEGSNTWFSEYGDVLPGRIQIVTDYEINGIVYPEEVAVFELTDQLDYFEPNDIVKFSFSKEVGLIFLELKSGLKYFRV
jgi:hypothetical protein